MFITLNSDPAYVDAGRRQVLVPQSVLCLDDAPRLLGNYPREGVARLVDVNLLDARLARVALQVFEKKSDEGGGTARPAMS